jgi:hypothetical protein
MITGIKKWREDRTEEASQQPLWRAALAAAAVAAGVYFLVN